MKKYLHILFIAMISLTVISCDDENDEKNLEAKALI